MMVKTKINKQINKHGERVGVGGGGSTAQRQVSMHLPETHVI